MRSSEGGLDADCDEARPLRVEGRCDIVGGGVGAVTVACECEWECALARPCCIFVCDGVVDIGGVGPTSGIPSS